MPSMGPLGRPMRALRRQLPPLNFLTVHWMYFTFTTLFSAIIFWGSSTPAQSVNFTNSLFFTVSAMTEAGLNPVNLSDLNTWQQIMMFLLIMLGSPIWVSISVLYIRRRAFQEKFASEQERRGRLARRTLNRVRSFAGSTSRRNSLAPSRVPSVAVDTDNPEKSNGFPRDAGVEHDGAALEKTLTPPERRGGPEMNRIITNTSSIHIDPAKARDVNGASSAKEQTPATNGPVRSPAITFRGDTHFAPTEHTARTASAHGSRGLQYRHSGLFSMQGVGARPTNTLELKTASELTLLPSFQRMDTQSSEKRSRGDIRKYLTSATGWISRNSQFHDLTPAERAELGGYEYRAIEFLAWIIPAYFILWQLLGCLGCGAWIMVNRPGTTAAEALNPFWVGAFNAVSAFNNSGMSLLNSNMVAFQTSYYMLLTMGLLILAGNTAFPLFLRLIVWCFYKVYQRLARDKPEDHPASIHANTLRFLLDHPRRCYTNMFPSQHTWWLAGSVFALNSIDWAAFEILNINNKKLDKGLPLRFRVIDGLFQAFAVRSGGFYVVTIVNLRIGLLVLYVVMMYISVYPVVITIRNSNVYEERSLGIYAEDQPDDDDDESPTKNDSKSTANLLLKRAKTIGNQLASLSAAQPITKETNTHFIRHQLRAQIAHDAWFLVLALFLIMIIESSRFNNDPVNFSVFNFIFEIVSAYGCVGISIGVPYAAYSFSGSWRILSKLILCLVMLRGRHRGLPVAIDKAVMLPGEELAAAEEEDGRIRMARTLSRARREDGVARDDK